MWSVFVKSVCAAETERADPQPNLLLVPLREGHSHLDHIKWKTLQRQDKLIDIHGHHS